MCKNYGSGTSELVIDGGEFIVDATGYSVNGMVFLEGTAKITIAGGTFWKVWQNSFQSELTINDGTIQSSVEICGRSAINGGSIKWCRIGNVLCTLRGGKFKQLDYDYGNIANLLGSGYTIKYQGAWNDGKVRTLGDQKNYDIEIVKAPIQSFTASLKETTVPVFGMFYLTLSNFKVAEGYSIQSVSVSFKEDNDSWTTSANVGTSGKRSYIGVVRSIGTHTMYYKATLDGYVVEGGLSYTATKIDPQYQKPTDLTAVYGQTLADVTLPSGFTWREALSTPVGDAGKRKHYVTFTPSDTANYNTIENIEVEIDVQKANFTSTVSMSSCVYGFVMSTPYVNKNPEYGTVTYYYSKSQDGSNAVEWKNITSTTLDAGTYYMYAVIGETANYNSLRTSVVEFEVEKADIIYTAPQLAQALTYNGNLQNLNSEGTAIGGVMEYSLDKKQWSASVCQAKDAGGYEIWYRVSADENHNDVTECSIGTVTIAEKKINPVLDIAMPVESAIPQKSITGEGYTATITWSPAPRSIFAYNTAYTATVKITTEKNYTVDGIDRNGYAVSGALDISNAENSDTVTITYPKTTTLAVVTSYTVKFESNGGTKVANQTLSVDAKVNEPAEPKKDGYVFDGWYSNRNLTEKYDFSKVVSKNLILYAKWAEEGNEPSEPTTPTEPSKPSTPSGLETTGWVNQYEDVKENDWFIDYVKFVSENGLMSGISQTKFAPNTPLTRGMLVAVLYRMAGEPAVNGSKPFDDVGSGDYFENAVIWAAQNGIVKGISENRFAPNQSITREQIATIMYRFAQYMGYDVAEGGMQIREFDDYENISDYAISALTWAVNTGLMQGKGGNRIAPKDNATRAEIAAILQRFKEANK